MQEMPRKPHIEESADNILERGVIGPSVTPSVPYDEGAEIPHEHEEPAPPNVPADGTDAGR
jgi:hypothetical protein